MGLYSRLIFPCLCDLFLGSAAIAVRRRELLAKASGQVLEIGFGTGLNLPHYPDRVRQITTVDPNPGMGRLARRRVKASGLVVDQRLMSSEHLPFDPESFDCVVSTFTLCSIKDVSQALAEVFRVLRPGGRLLFLEHGLSPEPAVSLWQRRLTGLEMLLADGCRLDRDMRQLVGAQPFSSMKIEEFYQAGLTKTHGYFYRGDLTR